MKSRITQLEHARAMVELGTARVLSAIRRTEFIGDPVTPFERQIRKDRDRQMRAELARAKRGLKKFERAIRA